MSNRTNRTTDADLTRAFRHFLFAAEAAKLGTAAQRKRWRVEDGSPLYGRAYLLVQVGANTKLEDGTRAYPYGSGNYPAAGLPKTLGWSRTEAVATLDAYTAALWAPINLRRRARFEREYRKANPAQGQPNSVA